MFLKTESLEGSLINKISPYRVFLLKEIIKRTRLIKGCRLRTGEVRNDIEDYLNVRCRSEREKSEFFIKNKFLTEYLYCFLYQAMAGNRETKKDFLKEKKKVYSSIKKNNKEDHEEMAGVYLRAKNRKEKRVIIKE